MKNWILGLAAGLASLLGGILAVFNPIGAAITAGTIAGWSLLIVGFLQGYWAWKSKEFGARLGSTILAAAALLMGVLLLLGPAGDGGLLKLFLAIALLISGAAKLWAGRMLRGDRNFFMVMVAGGVSLLLGLCLLTSFPPSLSANIGLILAFELLANGVALIVLSLYSRHQGEES